MTHRFRMNPALSPLWLPLSSETLAAVSRALTIEAVRGRWRLFAAWLVPRDQKIFRVSFALLSPTSSTSANAAAATQVKWFEAGSGRNRIGLLRCYWMLALATFDSKPIVGRIPWRRSSVSIGCTAFWRISWRRATALSGISRQSRPHRWASQTYYKLSVSRYTLSWIS